MECYSLLTDFTFIPSSNDRQHLTFSNDLVAPLTHHPSASPFWSKAAIKLFNRYNQTTQAADMLVHALMLGREW
jgi:hypothetical protein